MGVFDICMLRFIGGNMTCICYQLTITSEALASFALFVINTLCVFMVICNLWSYPDGIHSLTFTSIVSL